MFCQNFNEVQCGYSFSSSLLCFFPASFYSYLLACFFSLIRHTPVLFLQGVKLEKCLAVSYWLVMNCLKRYKMRACDMNDECTCVMGSSRSIMLHSECKENKLKPLKLLIFDFEFFFNLHLQSFDIPKTFLVGGDTCFFFFFLWHANELLVIFCLELASSFFSKAGFFSL